MLAQIYSVLLQAPAGGGSIQLIFLVGMIAVMYFFMIRPQAKRQKEQKQFATTIDVGERVVTSAGIHGTIKRTNDDDTLLLEVHHGSFITIERSAVSMEMTNAFRKKAGIATASADTKK
ncbi:MAG: preprotein translocase subunit YajC [Chitinophagaceae bacterium]|nr:preprotein translocase subunit YajC [Chitinophagaceae bacterium]MCB9045829.1 preprotein translocase subunit YajC [Chitinophagales bacterium]